MHGFYPETDDFVDSLSTLKSLKSFSCADINDAILNTILANSGNTLEWLFFIQTVSRRALSWESLD